MHWRRKWQPTPVFLPGESQGRGSLVGYRLWGRTELDTTEATAAADLPDLQKSQNLADLQFTERETEAQGSYPSLCNSRVGMRVQTWLLERAESFPLDSTRWRESMYVTYTRYISIIYILALYPFLSYSSLNSGKWERFRDLAHSTLLAQLVKNLPAVQETLLRFLGQEDPLEEGIATHSSILAWRSPSGRRAWRATVHGVTKSGT